MLSLLVLFTNFSYRRHFFGPSSVVSGGVVMAGQTRAIWGHHPGAFTATYYLAIVVALVFTVFGGRVVSFVHAVLFYEIFINANGYFAEGGDRLACVVLFCMVAMRTDAFWSPTNLLLPKRRAPVPDSVSSVFHNAGLGLALAYLLNLYFWASVWKIDSHAWRNGTALFGILRDQDYKWFAPESLYGHHALLAVAGYLVVVVQLGLVVTTLLGRRGRLHPWFLLGVFGLHVGIAVFMGLWDFSAWLIAADILLIRTSDVDAWRWLLGVRRPGAARP